MTRNKAGFTLIEMAIVLVILGLVAGAVAPLTVSMIKRNKIAEGRKAVQVARDEIIGYVLINNRLPEPNFAVSQIAHSKDPWHKDLFIILAPDLVGQNICRNAEAGKSQTGLAVCLEGDCTRGKKERIAFIIGSRGENLNRQTEEPADRDGDSTDLETRLYSFGVALDGYSGPGDPQRTDDSYDDIIEYVSLAELAARVCVDH
ncbi:MAG TPA: type II secretion system protein [Thermodesulfobacteriaceae bacterium]|nr:type II secretion system protein [Thermodesulfobacteriaceae bacterium]